MLYPLPVSDYEEYLIVESARIVRLRREDQVSHILIISNHVTLGYAKLPQNSPSKKMNSEFYSSCKK